MCKCADQDGRSSSRQLESVDSGLRHSMAHAYKVSLCVCVCVCVCADSVPVATSGRPLVDTPYLLLNHCFDNWWMYPTRIATSSIPPVWQSYNQTY